MGLLLNSIDHQVVASGVRRVRTARGPATLIRLGISLGVLAASAIVAPASGQSRDTSAAVTQAAGDISPESPRAALEQFLRLARAGRFAEAARFLEVPDSLRDSAPRFAQRLKIALDRHLWLDMDRVSGAATGDPDDRLAVGLDQLGVIAGTDGTRYPVRLARAATDSGTTWRFTRGTVARIDDWYATVENRWLIEHLPGVLLRTGPLDILWWQWIALPVLLVVVWLVGRIGSVLIRAVGARLVQRTRVEWDDRLLERLGGPIAVAVALVAAAALLPLLSLAQPVDDVMYRLVRAGFFFTFFWALWRVVDVSREVMATSAWAMTAATSRNLIPLGSRIAKAVVLAMAVVAILSLLGFPVASLIAGLGIGGLALALAAQKTVENLFGAFSIGVDQPIREGDTVRVEEFVGTVESIGLRSTRFRTLDRTVITIPNGKLADMRLESLTARDRLRFATVIGLVYDTTAAQMREVLAGIERVLRAHPKLWTESLTVRFREFADSSLNIEVMAWFETTDWAEFITIRQEVLLQIMEVVERAGTSFAFPTRTVHLVGEPAANDGAQASAPAAHPR